MTIDIQAIRDQFPALSVTDGNLARTYFDNPGGTQVPQIVIDRMTDCLVNNNANLGGPFVTSQRAGAIVAEARLAMADFLNAPSPDEIIFGQNMTSLTFHMARSLARLMKPGDEIIVTRMDHDANISPWLLMARDHGLGVRWLDFDPETCEFDLADLDRLLNPRTRLAAINYASNATGTINNVKEISRRLKEHGALSYVDAVQYAPHGIIDVQDVGCDFLACSAYKFFGPHQGILWVRGALLETLDAYKVRPAYGRGPDKFETGTQSHEGMAGVTGAVDYFAGFGRSFRGKTTAPINRRAAICAAMETLFQYEKSLTTALIAGLSRLRNVKIHGITAADAMSRRVPTVSFSVKGHRPEAIVAALAEKNIFAWNGHNYAVEAIARLGLADKGGVVRLGLAHYNTRAEVARTVAALDAHLAA